MSELLPCPFCGGEPDEYEGEYGNGIYCMQCGAMVGEPIHLGFNVTERVSYEQAIEVWNTRAERTCEVDGAYSSDGWLDESSHIWTFELSCGHSIDSLWGEPPRHCPECGVKVVSE